MDKEFTAKINLSLEEISCLVDELSAFMQQQAIKKDIILRTSLTVEEILLNWLEQSVAACSLELQKSGRNYKLLLKAPGPKASPFLENEQEDMDASLRILKNLQLKPNYKYKRQTNIVVIRNILLKDYLLLAMLAAFMLGILTRIVDLQIPFLNTIGLTQDSAKVIIDSLIQLILMIALPLLFFIIIKCITIIGDSQKNKTALKSLLRSALGWLTISVTITALIAGVFIPYDFSLQAGGDWSFSLIALLQGLLTALIPQNIFAPFIEINGIQIIFLALLCGWALNSVKEHCQPLLAVIFNIEQLLDNIFQKIMYIMPVFVYCTVLWLSFMDYQAALSIMKMLIIVLLSYGVYVLLSVLYLKLKLKTGVGSLLKELLPPVIIGLATASSTSALPQMALCLKKVKGINKQAVDFSLPVLTIMSKPGVAVYFVALVIFCLQLYGLTCSLVSVVLLLLASVVLSVFVLPTAGGLYCFYAVIFALFGIPNEAISIALIASMFLDHINTAVNVFAVQTQILLFAQNEIKKEGSSNINIPRKQIK